MAVPNIHKINEKLKSLYPDAECSLEYASDPWRLLVAARLSAQCKDDTVNLVTPALFEKYPSPDAMVNAEQADVEAIIRRCGLYHTKAESIIAASRIIVSDFGGKVPDNMEDLLSLPGVGRKIANLVLGDIFGIPGIVADTHCIRINGRLGFYPESMKDPAKCEKLLSQIVPADDQSAYCHRMVLFGREFCDAKKPRCAECPLSELCVHNAGLNAGKKGSE